MQKVLLLTWWRDHNIGFRLLDGHMVTSSGVSAQIIMGMFVNYFFAGFILGKVPFRLSPSFRPMLQRGIDLPTLDVTYFTSLSYYILLLFGFQGIFRIVFRCTCLCSAEVCALA